MLPDERSAEEELLQRLLPAVDGYAELGLLDLAWEELRRVPASFHQDPSYLEVQLSLLMRGKCWEDALEVGRALGRACPDRAEPFIHTGYCLHELGRTEEALQVLREGPECLQEDAIYHYNMGCYHAVLGYESEAREYVRTAFALDEKLKDFARNDPDLAGLWSS